MEDKFHINDVKIKKDKRLGKLIAISVSPYIETPIGYCISANGWAVYNIPYNDKTLSFIRDAEEYESVWLDKEDFFYDRNYGFIHNDLHSIHTSTSKDKERETSDDFVCNDFDGAELATLYTGFERGYLTLPQKGDMFWRMLTHSRGCTLFFKKDFLQSLINEYQSNRRAFSPSKNFRPVEIIHLLTNTQPAYTDELKDTFDYSLRFK